MATRMQQRRGTEATWTAANPILAAGEIGFEIDTNRFKIGDGSNRWANLTYFTADAAAAIQDLIDGAPGVLDTLNELAAALGDDPAFFTTVATNLSNHESDTTNVHGIANTADLATKSYVDTAEADAISAASLDATTKANAAQAAAELYTDGEISSLDTSLKAYADQAEVDAKSYTDTEISDLDTSLKAYADQAEADAISTAAADATTKANNAQSAAESTAALALSSHANDTTNIHGIADTGVLVTLDGTQTLTNKTLTSAIMESPAMTGTPSAPTAVLGTASTQVATTAFVDAAIEALGGRNLVLDGGGV